MTLGSALLIIALFLFVVAFVARPLTTGAGLRVTEAERHLSELLADRDHVLSSLADLEMDHALQKIPAEDYEAQRVEFLKQGAEILRQIDDLAGEAPSGTTADGARPGASDAEAELEAAVAALRSGSQAEASGFCPQCGEAVVAGDRFCSHCGTPLSTEASHA